MNDDLGSRFDAAVALKEEGRFDEAVSTLRMAAESGHGESASLLGRLLCLHPHCWSHDDTPGEDFVSVAEPWLRPAAGRGDRQAALLLASLLGGQLDRMRRTDPSGTSWADEIDSDDQDPDAIWAAAVRRREDEAVRLLEGLLGTDPSDGTAAAALTGARSSRWAQFVNESEADRPEPPLGKDDAAGQALLVPLLAAAQRSAELNPVDQVAAIEFADALRWTGSRKAAKWQRRFNKLRDGSPSRFGWYVLELGRMVDHAGTNGFERIVTADAGELRWACEKLLSPMRGTPFRQDEPDDDQPPECLTLSVYDEGRHVTDIDLVPFLRITPDAAPEIDWAAFPIPELKAEPLPPGHPVLVALSRGAEVVEYGFSDDLYLY